MLFLSGQAHWPAQAPGAIDRNRLDAYAQAMRILLSILLLLPSLVLAAPEGAGSGLPPLPPEPYAALTEISKLLSPHHPQHRLFAQDPALRQKEAEAALALGDWPRLAQASSAWLALQPQEEAAKRHLAAARLRLNQPDQALALFPALPLTSAEPVSPTFAKNISYLIPGSGFLYLGQPGKALASLALNLVFLKGIKDSWHQQQFSTSLILLTFEAGWYLGGAKAAEEAALNQNRAEVTALQWKFLQLEF